MQFRLATLMKIMQNWEAPRHQTRIAPQHNRRLVAEPLEARYALSTLIGPALSPDTSLPSTDTSLAPASDPAAESPPPSDPLSADPPLNTAPQIVDFVYVMDGNWCTLTGHVIDDMDPTGLVVQLDGLVQAAILVDVDDYFSYVFEITPDLHGTIFAQTSDLYGLTSNVASVTV